MVINRVETWPTGSGYRNGASELDPFRGILRKSKSPRIRFTFPAPPYRRVGADSLWSLGDQLVLCASSTLSASFSRANDPSVCNEFVSDPRLNGLGGLARKAPPIWFSPFRLTPCGKKWKAFGGHLT